MMKKTKKMFTRVIGAVLACLLAVAFSAPSFAAENLRITIKNAPGLPAMEAGQFRALQIFKGTPDEEGEPLPNDWGASSWNNWTLADIEWGSAFSPGKEHDFLFALDIFAQATSDINTVWPGLVENDVNIFKGCKTAADVAEKLEGKPNVFMQAFARFVLTGSPEYETQGTKVADWINEAAVFKSLTNDGQTSFIDVSTPADQGGTGYYLVYEHFNEGEDKDNNVVSEFLLAVLGSQEIQLKGDAPTVDKNILGGNHGTEGDVAGIGDTVKFELKGTVSENLNDYKEHGYYYVFHDTLSKGLTYKEDSLKVEYRSALVGWTWAPPFDKVVARDKKGYVLDVSNNDSGATEINVTFEDLITALDTVFEKNVASKHWLMKPSFTPQQWLTVEIVVTYEATLNGDAVLGSEGNPNDVYLEYSNDPNSDEHGNTVKKEVNVYTFGLDLTKEGDSGEPLEGAGFLLSKKDGGKTYYAMFTDGDDGSRKLKEWEESSTVDTLISTLKKTKAELDNAKEAEKPGKETAYRQALDALAGYLLTSDTKGKIPDVKGIDEGTYVLTEVVTPEGYNTMDPYDFRIEALIEKINGDLYGVKYYHPADSDEYAFYGLADGAGVFHTGLIPDKLVNRRAPFLPFTGGVGTVIFYVLGAALIGGAVAYFVISAKKRKKRRSEGAR